MAFTFVLCYRQYSGMNVGSNNFNLPNRLGSQPFGEGYALRHQTAQLQGFTVNVLGFKCGRFEGKAKFQSPLSHFQHATHA